MVVGEDFGVAKNVHQKCIGAIGAVQLHPLPIGSCANAAVGGVGLCEPARPCGVGADGGVTGGGEVAVADLPGLFIAAEDDARFGAGGLLVQEIVRGGEVLGAGVQVSAEERCGPRG